MKVQVYFLSRNPRVIAAIATVILAIGFAVAWHLNGSRKVSWEDEFSEDALVSLDPLSSLEDALNKPKADGEEICRLLFALGPHSKQERRRPENAEVTRLIQKSKLGPGSKQLFTAIWDSLISISGEPDAILLTMAYRHDRPLANGAAARMYLRLKNIDRALFFLSREAEFKGSEGARKQEIAILFKKRRFQRLEEIAQDPLYSAQWNSRLDVLIASHRGEWLRAALDSFQSDFEDVPLSVAGLVALSGLIWFVILLQAIQMPEAPVSRLVLCGLGVVLGFLSTTPTLLLVVWSEDSLHLVQGKGFLLDLLYCFGGIGPREEFCKLAAFVPLLPILLVRRNKLEMLIVAGCVGLGFAISENLQYFTGGFPTTAVARFVSANFMHIAATGILGLALCEAFLQPKSKGLALPLVFLWVSSLHALYDAVQMIPVLRVFHFMEGVSFIWLTIVFFKHLRQWRQEETNYFWMPASIVTGLSLVSAACFVYASWFMGVNAAATVLAITAVEVGMFIYLLIWQTGNLRKDAGKF